MKTKINILITIFYMTLIAYVSLQPGAEGQGMGGELVNNMLHIPAYGLLFYLLVRIFKTIVSRIYLYAFTIAVLYGALNEYLQHFVPGRSMSIMDVILNAIGCAIALLLIKLNIRYSILNTQNITKKLKADS